MRISLFDHPFAAKAPQVFEVSSLGEWLLSHYGPVPRVTVQIFEGQPSGETEITGNLDAILHAQAEHYTVLQSPGTGVEVAALGNLFATMVISIGLQVALAPDESMPANVNRTQQSPNNALSARENQVRLLQRIEDIYGTVRSIPSMIMQSYTKYVQHKQVEVGYYCVGRGYYDISDVRDGATLVASITGASAAVYPPFTSPNYGSPQVQIGPGIVDKIYTVRRSVEVDGITLKPTNQIQLPNPAQWLFVPGGSSGSYDVPGVGIITVPPSANDRIAQCSGYPAASAVVLEDHELLIDVPDSFTFNGDGVIGTYETVPTGGYDAFKFSGPLPAVPVGGMLTISGMADPANNGTFEVVSKGGDYIKVDAVLEPETVFNAAWSYTINVSGYDGTRTVTGINGNIITLSGASFPAVLGAAFAVTASVQIQNITEWTDWVILPATDRSEVWVNVIAPMGLYADGGTGKTPVGVYFELEVEQLDSGLNPTSNVEQVVGQIVGDVSDQRAVTVEHHTAWTGPARVRMRRTTPHLYEYSGTLIDEIKWADVYSVSPVNRNHFGNLTTIHTVTYATPRATAARNRQLNCIASRLIPTYNGSSFSGAFDSTGALASGTIHATSKIVDILAAVTVDPVIGNMPISTLDMAQIWGVQQALDSWDAECGQFNYTLDSDSISYEDTVAMIANAAFCKAYRQNGRVRLSFDRAQSSNTALFTHRNKHPEGETITRSFANDEDYDGIEFVYDDAETEQRETIRLPLDGSYAKLKKIEIPGIRSYEQAWYRAAREYARIWHQRMAIELQTTTDARLLLPNSRIAIVDNTVFRAFDGDVIGQDGLELTLSRDVEFEAGEPHSILLMKRDGSLQSITCTPGSAPNKVLLSTLPSEAVVTEQGEDGIRTIFSFASDSARESQAWLVTELGQPDNDYMTVRAINYTDAYYASDTEEVPPKESVIL